MILKKHIYTLLCLGAVLFTSCESDDFSSDSSLRLDMGVNTVSFDTVFTEIGSATKQLKIYNRNNKSLNIQSIRLKHPTESGFRMNIDGQKGSHLNDVDILKKDSLYAFIEVTVNPLKDGNPVIIRDTIEFLTNGNVQEIYLEAVGQNVHMWKGQRISEATTLIADKPYLIYDSLVVDKSIKLNIEKGVKFYFRKDASLKVYGTINALGTVKEPVIMRGARFDQIDAGISFDNVPGQWDGIFFYPESYDNHLENLHARNAEVGMMFYKSNPEYKKATFINTIVHNTSVSGVTAINCNISATNSIFSNSKSYALNLVGGKYNLTHCTVANYYKWATRQNEALTISNTFNSVQTPLIECNMVNSIVYGSANIELRLNNFSDTPFNFQFKNSLIRYPMNTDPRFVDMVWNIEPQFKALNEDGKYVYDFDIKANSPAIRRGIATDVTKDIRGRLRNNTNPDIGCYEFAK